MLERKWSSLLSLPMQDQYYRRIIILRSGHSYNYLFYDCPNQFTYSRSWHSCAEDIQKTVQNNIIVMQKSSKKTLMKFLEEKKISSVLDVPSGDGWLRKVLAQEASIDGIDLFEKRLWLQQVLEQFGEWNTRGRDRL